MNFVNQTGTSFFCFHDIDIENNGNGLFLSEK